MNQDLVKAIEIYTTSNHIKLNHYLLEKSKDNLIAIFTDLLTIYINDKNSSSIREFITVKLAGYEHLKSKIGYNGFRHSSEIGSKALFCEAKPKHFDTEEHLKWKNKERKTSPSKLNGGGNFTDYTLARFQKDLKENPNMLVSGFVNGKLIYIFEFEFNTKEFSENLKKQLEKHFPDGDKSNKYLRSANFDYKDFILNENVKTIYLVSKEELNENKEYINKEFFKWMTSRTKS